eukprot:Skav201633  [mRNA]  locus=scaffold3582:214053:215072:- [translate_table: standard]
MLVGYGYGYGYGLAAAAMGKAKDNLSDPVSRDETAEFHRMGWREISVEAAPLLQTLWSMASDPCLRLDQCLHLLLQTPHLTPPDVESRGGVEIAPGSSGGQPPMGGSFYQQELRAVRTEEKDRWVANALAGDLDG